MVALNTAIVDVFLTLSCHVLDRLVPIHPIWEVPALLGNNLKLGRPAGDRPKGTDELVRPGLVVQEDNRIMKPAIELLF